MQALLATTRPHAKISQHTKNTNDTTSRRLLTKMGENYAQKLPKICITLPFTFHAIFTNYAQLLHMLKYCNELPKCAQIHKNVYFLELFFAYRLTKKHDASQCRTHQTKAAIKLKFLEIKSLNSA